jgi:uncharacterized iron-regulated membrane protein
MEIREMSALDNEFATRPGQTAVESARSGRMRKLWTSAHRWIGIIAGVYLVIAGVTGSILAFWQDIDEWLNRDIMSVAVPAPDAPYRPLSDIIAAARAAMPPEALKPGAPSVIKMPRHAGEAALMPYILGLPDKATLDEARRTKKLPNIDFSRIESHDVFVDPYRAVVTGERLSSKGLNPFSLPFIQMVNQLHLGLWIPFVGGLITAILALFLLISAVDGIVLWWPKSGKWKGALTFKRNASTERFVFDLHKIVGVYFGVVLLVSIFSGMYMNFKPPWRALVSLVSPLHEMHKDLHSQPANGRNPLSADEAVAIVDRIFPDGKLQYVQLPTSEDGVFTIGKRIDGEVNEVGTRRKLIIDQFNGVVLDKEDPREYGAGDKFFEWQYPLHSGEAFGNYGRAFMVFFGLVPVTLYVTGFIRWRHKRRAGKAMAQKKSS